MARKVTLTKDFDESVEVFANQANGFSTIVRVTVPRSRVYTFQHGSALILKLAKAGGAEISANSRMLFRLEKPSEVQGSEISGRFIYSAWRNIPLEAGSGEKTQFDVETSSRRRVFFLPGADLELPQEWKLALVLSSPDVVDWDEAGSHFEWDVYEGDVTTQIAS